MRQVTTMPDPLDALRLPVIPVQPRAQYAAQLLRQIRGETEPATTGATVRYFVSDVRAAIDFYRDRLGFSEELVAGSEFAMLYRGDLRLLLSRPGPAHALPDGALPVPGGWNRISLRVTDLAVTLGELERGGARVRYDIRAGVAVRHALVDDPDGNPVEIFEALAGYHERS